jgi:hypothetical protein
MNAREELTIRRAIKSGSLSPKQELSARRAIKNNPDDVSDIISQLQPRTAGRVELGELQLGSSEEKGFDTRTGVRDAGLRASLSAAETNPEQEAILQKFGLQSEDYLRDSRGRLAVTPEGGKKLGLELSENTLIDEEGFSRYDLADIAGIAPEVIGGIGGAIAGQILIPIPVLGAAIGAGVGAGGGSAVEEGIEALAGVSKQTAGEIAKDVATEATIGFLADATLGTFGLGYRALRGGQAGKSLTPEELEAAGKSIEMGIKPTLTAIRAPAIVGRQQAIVEKIFGTSSRLKKNNDVMQSKISQFRDAAGASTDEEAGTVLLKSVGEEKAKLNKLNREAQTALVKQLDDLAKDLGAAAKKNTNLESELLDYFGNAIKAFDDRMNAVFAPIDEALKSPVGSAQIIPTASIKSIATKASDTYRPNLAGRTANTRALQSAIDIAKTIEPSSSFKSLYQTRKALNDTLATATGKSERDVIRQMIDQSDNLLRSGNIESFALASGNQISEEGLKTLRQASKALDNARGEYKSGADAFDRIEDAGVVKNLRRKAETGERIEAKDIKLDRIVKNDTPSVLVDAIEAVSEGTEISATNFKELVAGQWLRDALNKSGISEINNYKPDTFRGAAFAKAVKDLGRTADVLFGDTAPQIKALANSIEKTSLSNMSKESVQEIIDAGLKPVDTLKQIELTQNQLQNYTKSSVLGKLADGDINPVEAAELIGNTKTTASDIKKIMNVFDSQGNEAAKQTVRGNFMQNLIADFGDSLTTDAKALKSFADRLIKANEGGKLEALFGEEMGKDMAEFAKILSFNSRTAAGGDLVAANIAASPLQNLGALVKYSLLGRFLASAPYYETVLKQYKKQAAGESAQEKANILGRILASSFSQVPAQLAQSGFQEGERQIRYAIENSKIGQELSNLSQQIQPPNISSGLAQVSPVPAAAPAGGLRERAKTDPGVAQALGIQGSTAGLL